MQAFVSSMQGFVQQLQQSMEAAGLPAHIVVEGGGGAGIGGGLAAFAALIEEGERLREMSGRRVVLQNLTQRRRWNGQLATVRGVDAGRRLLVVELDEGHPDAADDEGGDDGDEGEASGRRVALRLEKVRLATPFDELPPAEAVAAALEADDPDALESALARAVAAGVDEPATTAHVLERISLRRREMEAARAALAAAAAGDGANIPAAAAARADLAAELSAALAHAATARLPDADCAAARGRLRECLSLAVDAADDADGVRAAIAAGRAALDGGLLGSADAADARALSCDLGVAASRAKEMEAAAARAAERLTLGLPAPHAPAEFTCPITQEVMEEPVVASDGHTYERAAIERWMAKKMTSPKTGEALESATIFPNHSIRGQVREWQEKRL